jgi:hypothetical protein
MTKFVLIAFMGWKLGYLSVPGIATEAECHALVARINESEVGIYDIDPGQYACVPYVVE